MKTIVICAMTLLLTAAVVPAAHAQASGSTSSTSKSSYQVSRTVSGKIVSKSGNAISVKVGSKTRTFDIGQSSITSANGKTKISSSALRVGQSVRITHPSNSPTTATSIRLRG